MVELLTVTGIIIILAAVTIPTAHKTLNSAKKLLPQVQFASDIYNSSLLPNMEYSNSSLLNEELANRTRFLEKIINETGVNQYPDMSNSSESNITPPKVRIEVYYKVYFLSE